MPTLILAAWLFTEAFAGRYNSQGAATSLGQFFAAYFSLFIILLLPKCSLRMKVESMTSMLCFLPVRWPPMLISHCRLGECHAAVPAAELHALCFALLTWQHGGAWV